MGFILRLSSAFAEGDYKFLDENGNDVIFTLPETVYTQSQSGPWMKEASLHKLKVHSHVRFDGLESIRIVTIDIPHPMKDKNEKDGVIEKIYLLDKDGLIVGYHAFGTQDKKAIFQSKLNGVINYVKAYVFCSKHGAWTEDIRF